MSMTMDQMPLVGYSSQEYCGLIAGWLEDNRGAWCQGAMARDENGTATDSWNPGARAFCAMGLLERFVINGGKRERCVHLLSRVLTPYCEGSTIRSNRSPVSYNDTAGRTVGEIIQMFRCASYLPDVTAREPHEMLEQVQWEYNDALKEEVLKVPPVKTPDWLKFGDVIMSGSAAKLGLAPSKSWGKIMEEVRDAMAA